MPTRRLRLRSLRHDRPEHQIHNDAGKRCAEDAHQGIYDAHKGRVPAEDIRPSLRIPRPAFCSLSTCRAFSWCLFSTFSAFPVFLSRFSAADPSDPTCQSDRSDHAFEPRRTEPLYINPIWLICFGLQRFSLLSAALPQFSHK